MAFVVTEACIDVKDKSCIEVCPVDCIYDDDADRICYIEPDECIDCAVCVEACPVQAIFAEEDTPAGSQAFIGINAEWFKDKDTARAKINEIKAPEV